MDGLCQINIEMERRPYFCPTCKIITDEVHDYRSQKVQHTKILSRDTIALQSTP